MDVSFDCYPSEDVSGERNAYVKALDNMKKGDLVFIFTPDDLHFTMTKVRNRQYVYLIWFRKLYQEDYMCL